MDIDSGLPLAKYDELMASFPLAKYDKLIASLPCQHANLLLQLRTGHVPLNQHLAHIGRVLSETCPKGGRNRRTLPPHLLQLCHELSNVLCPTGHFRMTPQGSRSPELAKGYLAALQLHQLHCLLPAGLQITRHPRPQ